MIKQGHTRNWNKNQETNGRLQRKTRTQRNKRRIDENVFWSLALIPNDANLDEQCRETR